MNDKILRLLKSAVPRLVFALLGGGAYYIIALKFILAHTGNGGGLLGFFFFPAIVCGMGLIIIKILRSLEEQDNTRAMLAVFWTHAILIIVSAVFLAAMLA